jgi:exosome complex component RRP4
MPITILPPTPALPAASALSDDYDEEFDLDSDGDHDMGDTRPAKRSRTSKHVVTPGELVTDDTQWMRYG